VLRRDGAIAEIGPAAVLVAKHPGIPLLGTGHQVLLPGFVDAHHHIGLTPVQLGLPDMPLELWFVTRLVASIGMTSNSPRAYRPSCARHCNAISRASG
jgi:5-methylthioadenosine/S-adenosylhomocysteine deaminase